MLSANNEVYFFPSKLDVFYSLSWLISLATTSCIMFNESGEHGHLCLRGKAFNGSQLNAVFAVGFLVAILL